MAVSYTAHGQANGREKWKECQVGGLPTKASCHSRRHWFKLIGQFLNSLSDWNCRDYSTISKKRQLFKLLFSWNLSGHHRHNPRCKRVKSQF